MEFWQGKYSEENLGVEKLDRCIKADEYIVESKELRVALDAVLQQIKNSSRLSEERGIVQYKIKEAIMWLGMDLKDLGTPNPYPNSYKPENTVVDPTADGLKL